MSDARTDDELLRVATGRADGMIEIKTIGDGLVLYPLVEAAEELAKDANGLARDELLDDLRAAAFRFAAHHLQYASVANKDAAIAALEMFARWEDRR